MTRAVESRNTQDGLRWAVRLPRETHERCASGRTWDFSQPSVCRAVVSAAFGEAMLKYCGRG